MKIKYFDLLIIISSIVEDNALYTIDDLYDYLEEHPEMEIRLID